MQRFDGSSWTSQPGLSSAPNSPALVPYQGSLYLIGGANSSGYLSAVHQFDGKAWSAAPFMSVPRNLVG
eukprot:NODE_633_length_1286_cov_230.650768_g499_i0.p7 GENE.NODE_633_length_1286_cov_230.650768_g499_i0~~NODE_633_length_1286_cov_230.650768_g499_i0.p7  ORF type:complete len:69 (-),score=5.89 NODE_633_length_1286_cov_230.650768_g499_i0:440-646(-)